MKRFISVILSLAMLLALVPAVFVSAEEVSAEKSGIRIEYPTCQMSTEQSSTTFGATGDPKEQITYANSGGRIEWLEETTVVPAWNRGVISMTSNVAGQYGAYKIRVPKAGAYDITIQYRKGSNGMKGELYILPISEKDNIGNAVADSNLSLATVDFKSETGSTDATTAKFHEYENVIPWTAAAAGEYIVVWKVAETTKDLGSMRPANLIFDGGDGKAPIDAESAVSKSMLNAAEGETATITTSSVTMSDLTKGTADDIAALTYESSDTSVVSVSGNVIKAVGKGSAKVYTKSGDFIVAENSIEVIVPSYSGAVANYPISEGIYETGLFPGDITYELSGQRVEWYHYTGTKNQAYAKWNLGVACFQFKANEYAAFKINLPANGYYDVTLNYAANTSGCKADMYIIPGNTPKDGIEALLTPENRYLTNMDFYSSAKNVSPEPVKFGYNAAAAGEYIVVWKAAEVDNSKFSVWYKSLIFNGSPSDAGKHGLVGKIMLDKSELAEKESATVTSSLYDAYTGTKVEGGVTYTSDSDVLSVNGTTVTANKAGKVTLYAEASGYPNKVALEVVVEKGDFEPTLITGNIVFSVGADIEYKVGSENYKNLSANNVAAIPVGSNVTVKANDAENFAGWVRGTENSGVWVSGDAEYTFNIMSPTYLTPIYSTPKENATHSVEFWDENGAYVDTVTAIDGKAVFPKNGYGLVGGRFIGWWLNEETQLLEGDEVSKGVTRAVAKYNYGDYGKEISNKNVNATYWMRGDDIVKYGAEYNFYQWNGAPTITFGTEEIEEAPIVVLDATSVDGAYMIEYDKGNASAIVEVGIIFGSTVNIHIGSTDGSKAASQRNGDHGQFCAKPNTESNHNYARGYLIYRADNKLYVMYTTAAATSAE